MLQDKYEFTLLVNLLICNALLHAWKRAQVAIDHFPYEYSRCLTVSTTKLVCHLVTGPHLEVEKQAGVKVVHLAREGAAEVRLQRIL